MRVRDLDNVSVNTKVAVLGGEKQIPEKYKTPW